MYEIKEKYNLPDGSFKNYLRFASSAGTNGDWDNYKVEDLGNGKGKVWFDVKAFAKANGLTIEQVKSFFPEN